MSNQKLDVAMALLAAAVVSLGVPGLADGQNAKKGQGQGQGRPSRDEVSRILRGWPAGPQLAAQEMMAKYGPPQEMTPERLIWRDPGPFKRIMVTREELPHDFPIVHKDYLEHTISYKVPADKTDEVHAFDASITIHRASGELSARCDLESNNLLTLNLAHDVATGKRSVANARKEFGDILRQRTLGKSPSYATALQFKPPQAMAAAEVEATTLPGAPKRPAPGTTPGGDAEIMGTLVVLDQGEVHAAMVAQMKPNLPRPVLDYAAMLHEHHGKNILATVQLAVQIRETPLLTSSADALHAKHAGALAAIVPLDGDAFSRAFLDLMVKGHEDALQLLDRNLKAAKHERLKTHLTATRRIVADHLQEAKRLQGRREQTTQKTSSR